MFQLILLVLAIVPQIEASKSGYLQSSNLGAVAHYGMMDNYSLNYEDLGCKFCGDGFFYDEPPPNFFIPPPPLHPSYQVNYEDLIGPERKQQTNEHCNFCNLFSYEPSANIDENGQNMNSRIIALIIAFLTISSVLCIYLSNRRSKIITTIARSTHFKSSNQPADIGHQLNRNELIDESMRNSGHLTSDSYYLRADHDKNFISPIVSDHLADKKTSIPSKYWAQPGSIIGQTIRRIPNEYEVPSCQTNSTRTPSAIYGDTNSVHTNQKFFSPYNLHTYAEVRDVLDPNEQFHASSNSSVLMSESNYGNAIHSHGNCVLTGNAMLNGSVQMSTLNDFNTARSIGQCGQTSTMAQQQHHHHHHQHQHQHQHQLNHHAKIYHDSNQPIYEQPGSQKAQIIITSNNQGANPTLINYKERIHNVI